MPASRPAKNGGTGYPQPTHTASTPSTNPPARPFPRESNTFDRSGAAARRGLPGRGARRRDVGPEEKSPDPNRHTGPPRVTRPRCHSGPSLATGPRWPGAPPGPARRGHFRRIHFFCLSPSRSRHRAPSPRTRRRAPRTDVSGRWWYAERPVRRSPRSLSAPAVSRGEPFGDACVAERISRAAPAENLSSTRLHRAALRDKSRA